MIRIPRRLRGEGGYSLIEMLTVIAIMGVILTGLTTLFVQGTNAQMDMNGRFEAQQTSRLALDKLRREIHCASAASTSPGNGAAPMITLDLPSQCPTAVGGARTDVSWCTVSAGTNRYALYREVGVSCDSSGSIKWGDYLIVGDIFDYQTQSTAQLARLKVQLPVDTKPGDETPPYSLCDVMVLRNSTREAPASTVRGYLDTAELTSC